MSPSAWNASQIFWAEVTSTPTSTPVRVVLPVAPDIVRASERPTAMVEYENDMTAARMESHERSLKLGSMEKKIWTTPKTIMYVVS